METPKTLYEIHDCLMRQPDKLRNEQFLYEFLHPHCKFNKIGLRGSRLRIIQLPRELAQFLIFMSERKIDRYLEIGTSSGGSWFTIDSYLRAVNPAYKGSVGIDRKDKLRNWKEYKNKYQTVEFRLENTSKISLAPDEQYDMTFIDACHLEEWVWHDFNKVKENSRFVAFHDIVLGHGSTVDKFWAEAKKQHQSWEFIDTSLP